MARIEFHDVCKRFAPALPLTIARANLTIEPGEFCVFVGPSGCGKSTLLRMVAGLEEISGGEIAFTGTDGRSRVVNDVEPAERDIAMVFQNYALYPHMSVYDNMAFGLKMRKFPKAEIAKRVQEAAEILGIQELLKRKPRQLSGGQRQRVAVGRAIVRHPQVFLFDEPLSNLDAKLRVQMRVELKRLHERLETTAIYVTHDQVEAMTLGSRVVVMNAGVMEQVGTPEEVYQRPATTFVAGFIGSPPMNLVKGVADGSRFTVGGTSLALPAPAPRSGDLILGLRPEHAELHDDGPSTATWALQVDVQEMLGAERLLYARLGSELFTLRIDGTLPPPPPGATVRVTVRPERLHWFDAATGRRVE